jgi:Transglycosylase-like domain
MHRLTIITLLTLSACTPQQHQAWLDWFDTDPRAAVAFARNGCGGLGCAVDAEAATELSEDSGFSGVYWPWTALAECESNGNWHISTGNGFYGGLQFALGSWQAAGGSGYPHEASPAEQVRRGEILQDMQGWGAWPTCARIVGLL